MRMYDVAGKCSSALALTETGGKDVEADDIFFLGVGTARLGTYSTPGGLRRKSDSCYFDFQGVASARANEDWSCDREFSSCSSTPTTLGGQKLRRRGERLVIREISGVPGCSLGPVIMVLAPASDVGEEIL